MNDDHKVKINKGCTTSVRTVVFYNIKIWSGHLKANPFSKCYWFNSLLIFVKYLRSRMLIKTNMSKNK